MANRSLFNTRGQNLPKSNTLNAAGGTAYSMSDEHALCQFVVTGTFNSTYYVGAEDQLKTIATLLNGVSAELIAKAAVYGHERGHMKDMPAYFLAVLAARNELGLLKQVWPRVITTAKMLLNFVQIVRSGQTGRRSFGTAVRRLIREWLTARDGMGLFLASVGHSNPSLKDVIKMVRPKATNSEQDALFAYLLDKNPEKYGNLPNEVQKFETFKRGDSKELPRVPYFVLSNCQLTADQWKQIASTLPWNTLRMNINKLEREGVFNDVELTEELAKKLGNAADLVRKFNAFPYQLLTTFQNTQTAPMPIKLALQDALEVATNNVPALEGQTVLCVDTSGSMGQAITGSRAGSTSVTRCVDVAALIAACIVRKNPTAKVVVFDTTAAEVQLNPRDTVLSNAQKVARNGGGTNCEVALRLVNQKGWKPDNVVFVSDNESWAHRNYYGATGMMNEWAKVVKHNKNAKLVCIDLVPNTTVQAPDSKNVLNVGGFSDSVFDVLAAFCNGAAADFVKIVKATQLEKDI